MRWKHAVWTLGLCASVATGVITAGASPAIAQTDTSTTQSLNAVDAFDVEEREDGTYIRIRGSEVPTFSVFKLTAPLRLFVDISNSELAGEAQTERVNNGVISQVGLIEFEDSAQSVSRVIIGFDQPAHYDVRADGQDVVVFVDGSDRTRRGQGVARMQKKLKQRDDELAETKARLADLERRYQSALSKKEERVDAAAEKLERTRNRLETTRQELASLQSKLEASEGADRDRLQSKIAAKNRSISTMKDEVSSREAEMRELQKKVDTLQAERDAEKQRVRELAARAEEAQKERDRALELARKKEAEGTEARERAEKLQAKLSEAREKFAALARKKGGAGDELSDLHATAEKRQKEVRQKARQLEEARQKQARLESQLDALRAKVDSGEKSSSELKALERERAEYAQKLERRESELERARKSAQTASDRLDALENQLAAKDKEIARLKKSIDSARQERAREEEAARRANQQRLAALKEAVSTEKERVSTLRESRRDTERQISDLEKRREAEEARLRNLQDKVERATSRLSQLNGGEGRVGRAVAVDPTNTVRGIQLETRDGRSRIVVELDRPGRFETLPWKESRAVMILNDVELPDRLEKTLSAGEAGAVRFVSSYRDDEGQVRLEAELNGETSEMVRQDGNKLVWEFAPKVRTAKRGGEVAEQTRPSEGGSYTSAPPGYPRVVTDPTRVSSVPGMSRRRLTIDLRAADIQNVLRLLAKEGGVNIISGEGVGGTVTMRLRSVPLDEVFLTILQAKGLGFERRGNVIRVAPQKTLLSEQAARAEARRKNQRQQPLEVFLLPINYASAGDLKDQVSGLLSPRGSVTTDDRTNTLIIKDIPDNLSAVRMLVESLDTQVPQVLIEARIVETNDTFQQQLGIQWGGDMTLSQSNGNPTGLVFPSVLGLAGGATDGQTPTEGTSSTPNFAVNLPAPAGTGAGGALGLTLGSVGGGLNINLRLSALEAAGHAKIVSAPKILTLDNRSATISQGTSIPISVVSAAGVQTVFVDATLELSVTPHVTPDGNVQLQISASKNEPDFQNTGARGDPTIIRKTAETELLIKDGDTTVIGGIYTRNAGTSLSAVPFFHKIPILGFFFRTTSESERRTELLIFITPKIVNRAEALGSTTAGSVSDGYEEPAGEGGGEGGGGEGGGGE